MKFWLCYEVNRSDPVIRPDLWEWEVETFDKLDDAVQARWDVLEDKELYRNVSPILIAHPDRKWES